MSKWYACIGGGGDACRNTRNHFPIDAGFDKRFGFFAASAKDERISSLEPGYSLPFDSVLDQQASDFRLRDGRLPAAFSCVDQPGVPARVREDFGIHQIVIDYYIAGPDGFGCLDREQFRIAGSRADQENLAC